MPAFFVDFCTSRRCSGCLGGGSIGQRNRRQRLAGVNMVVLMFMVVLIMGMFMIVPVIMRVFVTVMIVMSCIGVVMFGIVRVGVIIGGVFLALMRLSRL
jgi:uncharacterized protein YqhQ